MTQQSSYTLPAHADTVVVGGGTAGAIVAARLAAHSDRSVLLLEAGPDYGPYAGGAWPKDLLDARCIPPRDHDWGYISAAQHGGQELFLERARVIGGCSAHNGCAAIWGSRLDYDGWAALGNPGWETEALLPLFRAVNEQLRVRKPGKDEITPWHRAVLEAAPGAGLPLVEDLNNLDENVGISASPVNIHNGVRWNTAIAYLDPVRARPNLTIRGRVLADRVVVEGGRAVAVEVVGPEGPARIETGQIVLSAGAFGSPAILLRSGIGDPDELRALDIQPIHALGGVGRNLHDHPALIIYHAGTPEMIAAMREFEQAGGWLCEEQTIAKARSSLCKEAFDLHLYPVGSPYWGHDGSWSFMFPLATMTPLSRGTLRLSGRDPEAPPVIDHAYLTDPEDRDIEVLLDGVELTRSLVQQAPLADLAGPEIKPGPEFRTRVDLRRYAHANCVHYYHPVGTCKMGPASDPTAVVDAAGRVHGLDGLLVADAAIMPVIPRANTNIPSAVVGEKIASLLLSA